MRESGLPSRVINFGGNLEFCPAAIVAPRTEADVLRILHEHRGRRIRAVGRLHSWSEAVVAEELLLDLRHLDQIDVRDDEQGPVATVGAGCQIKRLLAELDRRGLTLPSVGLISEQSLAGAVATGTHGSGRSSLSHYVAGMRIACYDPVTDEPLIRQVRGGDELRAARCSLGCLGVVLSVDVRPRPAYRVEEWFRLHESLAEVLAAEPDAPLQQFFLIPWLWNFLGQHRRESTQPRSWLAPLYRAYWFAAIDVALHLVLQLIVRVLRRRGAIKGFFRHIALRTVIRGWHVVDWSQRMLIMEHELFRHIEIEMFVPQTHLPKAVTFVREILEAFDGDAASLSPETRAALTNLGRIDELQSAVATYTHHYPICIRRVFGDDTLISMTSDSDEPYYAISFISYDRPVERDGFFRFARFLSDSMSALFAARPHWGKVCLLTRDQAQRLYPNLPQFREQCVRFDRQARFGNAWLDRLCLGKPDS